MQKLKNSLIERMLVSQMTKAEVDIMLELSHYQDDKGIVYGVYYKDVCRSVNISFETFYTALESLEAKRLVKTRTREYGDRDLEICGNDFSYPGALKEGYVNTGHDLFYMDSFKKLKAAEKLLAIQIIKIVGATQGAYRIGVENFYNKYSKVLQVTKRTIRTYLGKLRKFFDISMRNKNYYIKVKGNCFKYNAPSDIQNLAEHLTKVACRRNRAKCTTDTYLDVKGLVKQYSGALKENLAPKFLYAVKRSLELANEHIENKYAWNRWLNSKYIHKLILQ